MALRNLESSGIVTLDDERQAAMVSNLLVILCGETEANPRGLVCSEYGRELLLFAD